MLSARWQLKGLFYILWPVPRASTADRCELKKKKKSEYKDDASPSMAISTGVVSRSVNEITSSATNDRQMGFGYQVNGRLYLRTEPKKSFPRPSVVDRDRDKTNLPSQFSRNPVYRYRSYCLGKIEIDFVQLVN